MADGILLCETLFYKANLFILVPALYLQYSKRYLKYNKNVLSQDLKHFFKCVKSIAQFYAKSFLLLLKTSTFDITHCHLRVAICPTMPNVYKMMCSLIKRLLWNLAKIDLVEQKPRPIVFFIQICIYYEVFDWVL